MSRARTQVAAALSVQVPPGLVRGTAIAGLLLIAVVLAWTVPYAWNVLHP